MKALRCADPGVLLDDKAPNPSPVNGEVLIKVRLAGICRTDLELSKGYMGYKGILGHEFVGEVVSGGKSMRPGTRVVGEINAGCGTCSYCLSGMERHCPNRSVLGILNRDGCMAEYTVLPESNLLPVPHELKDEHAVFTEPLAAALEIFEQLKVEPAQRVCVIGDGKLGILIALVFGYKHEGETLLIGHHQHKLDVVEDRVATCLERDVRPSGHKSWDLVVEASGNNGGMKLAIQLVKPRGTIVLKTTLNSTEGIDLTPIMIDEVSIVGSRCGPFSPALRLLQKNVLPIDALIETSFPLDEAMAAWDCAIAKGAKKVLLAVS